MADETKTNELTGRASIRAGSYQPGEGLQMTPSQKAAAGKQPEPKTVAMDILRDGSFRGEYYHVGDVADVPEEYIEHLTLSGFAARADRAEVAAKAREQAAADVAADEKKAAERGGRRSTAAKPLTTHDAPGAEPPKPAEEPAKPAKE